MNFPITSHTLLVDLCETMTHMKELNLSDLLGHPWGDKVLRAISVSMPQLQNLNIAYSEVSLSALECLLPTEEIPRSGCPDLQVLNLMGVSTTVEFLKKIIIRLPKLRSLKHKLMVDVLVEITDDELGMNSGRCLENLYLDVPKKQKDPSSQCLILENAPVFAVECNVTQIDIVYDIKSIVSTKVSLLPLKKLNSISFHRVSKSRDGLMSLLESKGDCLEYVRLTKSNESVSLYDIIRTCPKLKNLMVSYPMISYFNTESDSAADPQNQKEEQIDRCVLPCLKKIALFHVTKDMCSSETLISLLLSPQLEEISLSVVQAMSNDVMFKVMSSSRAALSKVKHFALTSCSAITAAPFVQWLSMDKIALDDLHFRYCEMEDEDVLHAAVKNYPRPLNVSVRPVSQTEFPRYLNWAQGPCVKNCHCCAYKRLRQMKGPNSQCWKVSKTLKAEYYAGNIF